MKKGRKREHRPADAAESDSGSSGSDVEERKKKRKKRKKVPAAATQSSISLDQLPVADFSNLIGFKKIFWTGSPGQDPPGEELKLHRKQLGVICKGQLGSCPPPLLSINDGGLPSSFSEFFKYVSLCEPSLVQKQCWPAVLAGLNVLVVAPTGSGKTLAYVLPMMPHITARANSHQSAFASAVAPKSLVLVPTRELAIQVTATMKPLKKLSMIKAVAIYGGQDRENQLDELKASKSAVGLVVVATPGRLLDLVSTESISLGDVTYLVIDEADRMLAMGFFEQLTAIASQIRPDRQTLLFSATFPGRLREAATQWCADACTIRCNTVDFTREGEGEAKAASAATVSTLIPFPTTQVGASVDDTTETSDVAVDAGAQVPPLRQAAASNISSLTVSDSIIQDVHVCVPHKRPRLLIKYVLRVREQEKQDKVRQAGPMLIFCTTIKTAGFVHGFLKSQNVAAEILHGQLKQNERERVLNGFRAGKIGCLVSTDVAARGIHVKNLKFVVNYDFPNNLEQYCHRIGRTGRQDGKVGHAYSFFTRNMAPMAPDLLTLLRRCNQIPEPNLVLLGEQVEGGTWLMEEEEGEGEGEES